MTRNWHNLNQNPVLGIRMGNSLNFKYRKIPNVSDARKLCCKILKIQENRPNLGVFHPKDADGIANSEDPDQTAPRIRLLLEQSDLGLHCLPRPICPKTLDHYDRHYLKGNISVNRVSNPQPNLI